MLTVISMFSPCAQWVFGPLSPVSASGPLPTSRNSGNFSGFLAPTNEFEEDTLPFSSVIENSSFCSYGSCTAFLAPRNNDERCLQSFGSPGSAVPSSGFDDSHPTLGYVEDFLSPASLEVNTLSLCIRESYNLFHSFRLDPDLPSRVNTLGSGLHPGFVQPLHDSPTLDDKLGYAMNTPTGVVWLADLSPADNYNSQSEPEPPDPSCASH